MQFYNSIGPNPKTVRMFMAEKGIELPKVKVDLMGGENRKEPYLAKNPAGWLEALDVIAPPPSPVLLAVNAQGPDGRDTSWLWDVDYRRLRGRNVLVGGERRLDLAVRLEADEVRFRLVNDIDEAIDAARSPSLEVLANYTAFQQYRTVLGRTQ